MGRHEEMVGGENSISAIQPVWCEHYDVRAHEIDEKRTATLPAICNYFQNSAWNHVEPSRYGFEDIEKRGQIWLLSRFLVNIFDYPGWGDRVFVETWAKGTDRLFILRDFLLLSEDRRILAAASSAWLMVDLDSHRLRKFSSFEQNFPVCAGRHGLDLRLGRIPPLTDPEQRSSHHVCYSDLDMQHHANNVAYIGWILDSYPLELMRSFRISSFEINYLAEAQYGEGLTVYTQVDSPADRIFRNSVVRAPDHREICRARVRWVQSAPGYTGKTV